MSGYFFVLTVYWSGRIGISERRCQTAQEAERLAALRRKRAGVKTAGVRYQAGQTAVDIKNFI